MEKNKYNDLFSGVESEPLDIKSLVNFFQLKREIEKGSIDERVNLFDNNQNHSDIVELFDLLTGVVLEKMPYAEIEHVGGSAVPGLLTAGDLDVEITVPTDKFDEAQTILASMFKTEQIDGQWARFFFMPIDKYNITGVDVFLSVNKAKVLSAMRDLLLKDKAVFREYSMLKDKYKTGRREDYEIAKAKFWLEKIMVYARSSKN